MTERDERRARLDATITISLKGINLGLQYQFQLAKDLRDELEATARDRKALAEARELLGNIPDSVVQIKHLYPRWHRAIVAFLKRTEPTDD